MMHSSAGGVVVVEVLVVDVVTMVESVVVDCVDVTVDVLDVEVFDVVFVLQATVSGADTEIVAVPAVAASNCACRVPSESYVPDTRGRTTLSDVEGIGNLNGPPV
jgi:hypothetical protein